MKRIAVASLLLILGIIECRAESFDLIVVSLARVQKEAAANTTEPKLPIDHLNAIVVGVGGDLLLIGRKTTSAPLELEDVVLALRALIGSSQPPGVRMSPDVRTRSTSYKLLYSGGIRHTSVGAAMTVGLQALNRIAAGQTKVPPGFWIHPGSDEGRTGLIPHRVRCDAITGSKIAVIDEPGVSIAVSTKSKDRNNLDIVEWNRQLLEEYAALTRTHSAFQRIRNFLALYEALDALRKNIRASNWAYLLNAYRVTDVQTRRSLEWRADNAVFTTVGVGAVRQRGCRADAALASVRRTLLSRIEKDSESAVRLSALEFTTLSPQRDQRLARTESHLRALGLTNQAVFLSIRLSVNPPMMSIIPGSRSSTRRTNDARLLKDLILRATDENHVGDDWEAFHRDHIAPFVSAERQSRPLIGLISDNVDADWLAIAQEAGFGSSGMLFPITANNNDPLDSILRLTTRMMAVPTLARSRVHAVLVRTEDSVNDWAKILKRTLGPDRVLINPNKGEFLEFLGKPEIDVLLLDGRFRQGGFVVRDGNVGYESILALRRLDHIRFLAINALDSGQSRIWDRDIIHALQANGVGIISVSRGTGATGLDRLRALVEMLHDPKMAQLRAFVLPDVIAPAGGTTYWGQFP
ncbi:hypothetical protein [Pelagibius sp. Alg239-R121]|uniref:hypothetical protein n=1 Tax=Pelagibius sp. Alg239-R121 TaxID=2993448 RepID=UPI0024A682BC|nr:hypothetical protein [Pelagibius sp. Alg239-R121]